MLCSTFLDDIDFWTPIGKLRYVACVSLSLLCVTSPTSIYLLPREWHYFTRVLPLQTLQQLRDREICWDSGQSKAGQPMFSTSFMVWSWRTREKRCLQFRNEDLNGKWQYPTRFYDTSEFVFLMTSTWATGSSLHGSQCHQESPHRSQQSRGQSPTHCSHACNTQTPR